MAALVLGASLMAKPTASQVPCLTPLTLDDVVEILGEYSVLHQELPNVASGILYGMVNYNTKKIYLNTDQDRTEMRDTLLHELYHVKARKNYCGNSEDEVDLLTKKTIGELYIKPQVP